MQPPPAPPPPPPLHLSAPFLSSGRRAPTNSNRENPHPISAASTASPTRLDPQTLQHAVANLRKTQYDRPIRSDVEGLSDGRMDGSNVRMYRRSGAHSPLNAVFQPNETRRAVYAPPADSGGVMPFGNVHRPTDSLNINPTGRQEQQYYSTYSKQNYYQYSSDDRQPNEPYISNPRAHIRAYATQTPASSVFVPTQTPASSVFAPTQTPASSVFAPTQTPASSVFAATQTEFESSSNCNVNRAPQPQKGAYCNFAKELRDQGLTRSQRIANQFQTSQVPDRAVPQRIDSVFKEKEHLGTDQIDSLIRDMEWRMRTGIGAAGEHNCSKCGEAITNDRPGCAALDQIFHIACFQCDACGKKLAGSSFYNVDGKPLCEDDYKKTLEKCTKCGQPIMEKLLRASGSAFHPACFVCSVCSKCLDGVPFTVDSSNNIHCVPCFHQRFAPRCAVCSQPIVPEEGEKESVRVVAMDKSFHVNCYRCEDCHIQLSSKIDGQGCYPLDQHLYCKNCNGKRLIALSGTA